MTEREKLRFTKSREQLVNVIKKYKATTIRRDEIEFSPEDVLGKGGFSVVYEGVVRGCAVAIKKPLQSVFHGTTAAQLGQFKEEVKMLSKIAHPNLCLFMGCYYGDVGEDVEVMIITELLGEDLKTVLLADVAKRPISMLRRMQWVTQAARGMNWLHHSGIIHLDFKLSNCMLDRKGQTLKIADFGLSKAVPMGRFVRNPKSAVGTPIYTAPEIIKLSSFSGKSDVYSFGICLSVFITRVSATDMMNALDYPLKDQFLQAVLEGLRPDIEAHAEFCPPALLRLAESCWTRDASERPTFQMILERLEGGGLAVESAVRSRFAASVWMSCGAPREHLPFAEFWAALMLASGAKKPKPLGSASARLFRMLLRAAEDSDEVHVERWDKIVGFFGPGDVDGWIQRVKATCRQPWFFGDLTSKDAEQYLRVSGRGCFLVRFSSRGSSFTLSYVKGKKVYHTRILHDYEGISFQLEGAKEQYFASLEKLVASIIKSGYEKISQACGNWPFAALFSKGSNIAGGYIVRK